MSDSANSRWSGGHQVESEVKRISLLPGAFNSPGLGAAGKLGPIEQAGGCVL